MGNRFENEQSVPKGAGKRLIIILVSIILLFQLITIDKTNPPYNKKDQIQAPKPIMNILKRSCWDCHSNDTIWPWYANIAPFSWTISRHVKVGRQYVNFSIWNTYTPEQKDKKLTAIYKSVHTAMPLSSYTQIHKKAILTKQDRDMLRSWTGKSPF